MEPIANDRLAGVSAFVASAEAGSFAQAAERLGLTRSAVGKAVARLEERLGARLFVRTTRSLGLTEDGQMFYERCAQALEDLDAARHMLEAGRREVVGRLRISAPVVFGRHHVAPLLLELAQLHPRLRIEASFTDRQLDFADDGIDLAIRSGELSDSDWLVARRLVMQTMVLCASPAYLQAHGAPRSVADLAGHRCIAYMRSGRAAPWGLAGEDGSLAAPVLEPALGFDDIETIATATLQGAGLAHMPLWRVRSALDSGALVRLLPEVPAARIPLHVLWPRTRRRLSSTAMGSSARPIFVVPTGWKMVVAMSPARRARSSSLWYCTPGFHSSGAKRASALWLTMRRVTRRLSAATCRSSGVDR